MKELTIATYNILHGHDAGLDWSRLAAVINQKAADVVGLQEVDMGTQRTGGADTVTALAAATGLPHTLFIPAMDFDGGQYGTAILSRYPITAAEVRPLPSAHYEPRAFGCATLDLGEGRTLSFLNTHLSYESTEQQTVQLTCLASWLERHVPDNTPAVLTGDFNTEDFTMFTPIKSLGYGTVNSEKQEFKTFRPQPMAIDNILYTTAAMTPIECGMIDADTSDHNLLWCRFSLL